MPDITITVTQDKIKECLEKAADDFFKSSYSSNPLRQVLEDAVKARDGEIRMLINGIISEALADPEFKNRIADVVVSRMIEGALRKN